MEDRLHENEKHIIYILLYFIINELFLSSEFFRERRDLSDSSIDVRASLNPENKSCLFAILYEIPSSSIKDNSILYLKPIMPLSAKYDCPTIQC